MLWRMQVAVGMSCAGQKGAEAVEAAALRRAIPLAASWLSSRWNYGLWRPALNGNGIPPIKRCVLQDDVGVRGPVFGVVQQSGYSDSFTMSQRMDMT